MSGKTELLPGATSYIVRLANGGHGSAAISASFDYRRALKGEWERLVISA